MSQLAGACRPLLGAERCENGGNVDTDADEDVNGVTGRDSDRPRPPLRGPGHISGLSGCRVVVE